MKSTIEHKTLIALTLIMAVTCVTLMTPLTATAQATSAQSTSRAAPAQPEEPIVVIVDPTPEEILQTFQQEARAAYKMNMAACEGLSPEDKKICLAKARLQYDADMRYAKKRADQGY
jgi:hypothetical protein